MIYKLKVVKKLPKGEFWVSDMWNNFCEYIKSGKERDWKKAVEIELEKAGATNPDDDADHIYFEREEDRTLFVLRWS